MSGENGTVNGHIAIATGLNTPADVGPPGSGVLATSDGHHDREDRKMLASAIRRGWVLPNNTDALLPKAMAGIALNPKRRARDRTGAARVVVAMQKQNQADEHKQLDRERAYAQGKGDVPVNVNVNVGVKLYDNAAPMESV